MYVMLGATGQVGRNALKTLQELEPDARIRIVTRHPPRTVWAKASNGTPPM